MVVLGYIVISLIPMSKPVEHLPQKAPLSKEDKEFFAQRDQKKQQSMYALLNIINYTYVSQKLDYPLASEEGWKSILDTVSITDSFFDPYTNTIYTFAEDEPQYGEIQYGPGYACEKNSQSFKRGYGHQSLALRAKFSEGIRCINNFQG